MRYSIFPRAVLLGVALSVAGCGEMVFKRGADPGAMGAAQAECRALGADEAVYLGCMERKGFLVKGSQDSVFVDGVLPQPVSGAATPAVPAGGSQAAAASSRPVGSAPVVAPGKPAVSAVAPPPKDPLERVAVGSWWKLGGTAEQLAAAQAKCVGTLGPAHRPLQDSGEVTRAMVDCLRDAGWRGFGN
jgi:hypothetical protein